MIPVLETNPMATSANFASQLTDEAKEVLLARYVDLKFVDEVTELLCKRCRRVVIHHYVANCGHLFCRNCKRILSVNEKWKNQCHECKEYITNIERQDVEVERRVNELKVHCPNHKYGCKMIGLLKHIPDHLAECVETRDAILPALYDETNSKVDILIKLADFKILLEQIGQKIDSLKTTVDENRNLIDEIKNEYQRSSDEIRKATAKASTTSSRGHEYNILLLGPRWSGKSTFINSLANYLKYETIEEAMNGQLPCLIPGRITFKDPNNEEKTISFGAHNEQSNCNPLSKTCQCYELKFNDDVIRLIECPGLDDEPREQQLRNWQNVIEAMSNYQQLHAIAIVLRPYETALIYDLIKECIDFVLSHLEQTAVDNLIFIVTCSNEDPAMDTEITINKCMTEIMLKSKMSLNLDENRFYRMDNCGFHYLIMKSYGEITPEDNEDVWSQSVNECQRLIQYIINGLKPHLANNTINLNEAQHLGNVIGHLPQQIDQKLSKDEKYLAILTKNKEAISNFIKDHKELVENHANQIHDSTKDTFICKSDACRLEIVINSTIKTHYPHSCANPTYGLFTHGPCADCHCSPDKHEKVDSKTRAEQLNALITDVQATIEKAELDQYSMERVITQVQAERKQLMSEKEIISSAVLKLNKYYQSHVLLQPTDQDTMDTENTTNQYDTNVSNIKQQLFQLNIYGTEIRNAYV